MRLKFGCILVWASLILTWPLAAQEPVTFIPFGATWSYLDDGSDQGTNWVTPDFDDGAWPAGPAQLGYGEGDEATVINSGPNGNRIPTTYFRHAFEIAEASAVASLDLAVRRDDGIIVYLNGVEVFRDNMPPGPIAFNQYSFMNAQDDGNSIFTGVVPPELLVDGVNVIAAEVHQDNGNSSDVSFDLELTGVIAAGPPLIISQPEPVTVFENSEASFTVTAAGASPLTYQWDVNGMPLPDATNATLVIANVSTNDAGIYRVIVQNEFGMAVSGKAALTVLEAGTGFSDDFEPDIDRLQWLAFGGEVLATNYGGSVSGVNSLWFGNSAERFATTRPLNTSSGGTIGFHIRFADGPGNPWENADLPTEGVVLEYSNDGGNVWNEIGRYDTEDLKQWTAQLLPIPPEAEGPAVSFRWRQPQFSSGTIDHWALDDIQILVGPSAPAIFRHPSDLSAGRGGTAIFEVTASGSTPLSYQWTFNGSEIVGGTNRMLRLENVSTNDAGLYQVLVSNSLGEALSDPAELTVLEVEELFFQISALSTNGAQAIEHNQVSQDDHGGIVASSTHVIYNGQNSIGRFNLADLGGGTDLGVQFNALISNLQSGQIYTLANGNTPIQEGGGTVTSLLAVNSLTGALTGERIDLGTSFFLPQFFSGPVGFFSGFGRAVIYNGTRAYAIYFSEGVVLDLGALPGFQINTCENGGFWGVTEQFDGATYLAYVQSSAAIVRRRIPDGATEDILRINGFPNLSDMCAFTVTPFLERWYFHHEGTSVFRGGDETIGFANATMLFDLPDTPPRILGEPDDVLSVEGLDISFSVRAFGSRPLHYQWLYEGAPLAGAADDATLDLAAVTVSQSGGYQVIVSNEFGSATSRVATATIQMSRGRIGYFSDGVGTVMPDMNPSIVAASFTPVPISNILTFDFDTVDMLMIYEQGFTPGFALQSRLADIETWVHRGGKVIVHDVVLAHSSPSPHPMLFGAPSTEAQSLFSDDINLVPPGAFELAFGPHGNLGATSLDNGDPSATGYVLGGTLPAGATVFLNSGTDPSRVVSLAYGLGAGFVYFSTIPIGLHVGQTGFPAELFREVYLPNLIEYMDERIPAGAPVMGAEPVDQFVLEGADVSVHAGVRGEGPLEYQWYFDGAALPDATDPILMLSGVTLAESGGYQLVAGNASGAVTSRVAQVTVRGAGGESFRILNFTDTGLQTREISDLINDDRGGLAVSSSRVFYNGDGLSGGADTIRVSATDLSQGASLGVGYEGLVSNLKTERVYVLANGDTPLTELGGVVTTLLELDDNTGAITANRIDLSTPILLPRGNSSGVGIFSGFDRILLHTGTRAYHISLPSGEVLDAGPMAAPLHTFSETWAYWGVAEYFDDALYLVCVGNSREITRTRVPDGMRAVITQFSNLNDISSISISPTLRRWYFQFEGTTQFGSGTETLGFADVALEYMEPTGPPEIRAQPADQNVYAGRSVTFQSRAVGTQPLVYQWQYEGADLPGQTNETLALPDVTTELAGEYRVVVSNAFGTATSQPARLLVIEAKPFRIVNLLTSNSRVVDHNNLTGDDHGGIAISSSRIFYNGNENAAHYNAGDLSGGAVAGSTGYDSLVGELETETVYTFADGNAPLQYDEFSGNASSGQVTSLIEINGSTGDVTANRINLSRPIPIPQFQTMGFFAGVGRVVLMVGDRVYSVELPSGAVFDLGTVLLGPWQSTENWINGSLWGIAEWIDGVVHLAYVGFDPVNFNPAVLRTSLEDSTTTVISQFNNLSDMAAFTVSLSRNRWYFHYEGGGQFGGQSETLGYADAVFEFERAPTLANVPLLRFISEDGTSGPIPFMATDDTTPGDRLIFTGWSTNAVLVPTNNIVFSGTGPGYTVEITPAPNLVGTTRVIIMVTDAGGKSASAEMVVSIRAVNDAPSFTGGPNLSVLPDAGPQLIAGWASDILAGPPDESDQTLTFQASVDNPGLFAAPPALNVQGDLTFTPLAGATGTAAVTVTLQDNGGTASGGVNTSAPYVFQITVSTPMNVTLTSLPAEDVSETSATLRAELIPNAYQTSAWFEWGTTTNYGDVALPGIPVLVGQTVQLSAAVAGLTPGTTYHYRAVATNELGMVFGDDVSFATESSLLLIDSIHRDDAGVVRLEFTGRAGQSYEIHATDRLGTWSFLGLSSELGEGRYEFIDATGPNEPIRFYQIVLP